MYLYCLDMWLGGVLVVPKCKITRTIRYVLVHYDVDPNDVSIHIVLP